ncbi:hypothetical protein LIER_23975 [Lithospermum erythrorhizon]|uniref:Uncharacterized protein n=1 Tax=Lithospermum erythrorhizon TaxID=34254 RepID=A0AAV3QZH0_LITER
MAHSVVCDHIISQAKDHHFLAVNAILSYECSLLNILLSHEYLVISSEGIQKVHHFVPCIGVHQPITIKKRVTILRTGLIDAVPFSLGTSTTFSIQVGNNNQRIRSAPRTYPPPPGWLPPTLPKRFSSYASWVCSVDQRITNEPL